MAIKIHHEVTSIQTHPVSRVLAVVERWLRSAGGLFIDWVTGGSASQ